MASTDLRGRGRVVVLLMAVLSAACSRAAPAVGPQLDPNVRGSFAGEFFWAIPEGPDRTLPEDVTAAQIRDAAGRITGAVSEQAFEAFPTRVVAAFPSASDAEQHATTLRTVLAESAPWFQDPANADAKAALDDPDRLAPMSRPEIDYALASGNAPSDRGIGWGGAPADAEQAVTTVGPLLVVTGIEADQTAEIQPPHPLVAILGGYGAHVVLEGDRAGEGSIVLDLTCRPRDSASGTHLLDELGDAMLAVRFDPIPPWVAPPTESQALARATLRRYNEASIAAFDNAVYRGYVDRLVDAVDDPEEYKRLTEEMGRYMAERAPSLVSGEVDPEVLGLLAAQPTDLTGEAYQTWQAAIGDRMGRMPHDGTRARYLDWMTAPYAGGVRHRDGRLDIAWATFARFSTGGLQMIAYLNEHGCTDVRFGLVDFDAVRGD